jgi:hypothetical protein
LPGDDGHFAFTRQLAAVSHDGEAQVGHWLHVHVMPGDRAIATLAETIADTRRVVASLEQRLTDAERRRDAAAPPEEVIAAAREGDRLRQALEAERRRASAAAVQLAELLASRRHTLDQARSAAAAWISRYDRLVAFHRRGYLRRRKGDGAVLGPPPPLPPFLEWADGDLPLLVPQINPEAGDILAFAMTRFDPRPAVVAAS